MVGFSAQVSAYVCSRLSLKVSVLSFFKKIPPEKPAMHLRQLRCAEDLFGQRESTEQR
jgi:hypothetical protein